MTPPRLAEFSHATSTTDAADESAHPFDSVAACYDEGFSYRLLGRWLRQAVWNRIPFRAGTRVLDLGCGTGEDASWLARRGVQVTGVDASPAMIEVARDKLEGEGLIDRARFVQADLGDVGALEGLRSDAQGHGFDGALSNFGVINCLPDRRPLAHGLATALRPGGRAVLVVAGRLCPWEIVWHVAHGRFDSATRRFRRGATRWDEGTEHVPVSFPTPEELLIELGPRFDRVELAGLGVFLPPTDLSWMVERWPDFFANARGLERWLGSWFPWNRMGDHYVLVVERRGSA
jgi:SAM-dependent methyltransferase